jgi:cullin 1
MCTQRSPYNWSEQLYARHADTITIYLSNKVLPVLKERHGEFLLRELVLRDSNHSVMNKWLWKFFCYLDRYYVKYHALPLLREAGLKLFKNIILECLSGEF